MPEPGGPAALLKLLTWLSPAYPVGAFAYSHGLERAILDGAVHDQGSLRGWLEDLAEHGSAWNDAVLLAAAWNAGDAAALGEVAALGEALAGSRERWTETTLQGGAFLTAARVWAAPAKPAAESMPYSVAVGAVAAAHAIPLVDALAAYLHAFLSNLVQAAVRLVPLGQTDGLRTLAALDATIVSVARRAAAATLDDLGSACIASEIAAMRHETQYSRVFRT